ncbi:MAG: hypothetical protein WC082_11940 [Victivallales bacterium]
MNSNIPSTENTEKSKSFWQKQAELWMSNGKSGVSRNEIKNFSCGTLSAKYMANLDCLGLGPEAAIRQGREIIYTFEGLVPWLEKRTETVSHRKAGERHD